MNLIKFNKNLMAILFIAIIALLPILFTSCEKDTIAPSEHFEPQGLQIKDATKKVIIKIMNGEINPQYSDEFEVPLNSMTEELEVEFLDANGNVIEPPISSEYSLKLSFGDKSIAEIYQHDGERWAFHIKGLKVGITDVELSFNHNDHADFKTPKIKVKVDEPLYLSIFEMRFINTKTNETIAKVDKFNNVTGGFNLNVGDSISFDVKYYNKDGVLLENLLDLTKATFGYSNYETQKIFQIKPKGNEILPFQNESVLLGLEKGKTDFRLIFARLINTKLDYEMFDAPIPVVVN